MEVDNIRHQIEGGKGGGGYPSNYQLIAQKKLEIGSLLLLTPLVLLSDLLFFARREVILDVESLPNVLRRFALDHVCHCLASHIQ